MAGAVNKVSALWRQGWNELPELMYCSFFFFTGVAGLIYSIHRSATVPNYHIKRFKASYKIYRPGDPRLEVVPRFPESPVITSTAQSLQWMPKPKS